MGRFVSIVDDEFYDEYDEYDEFYGDAITYPFDVSFTADPADDGE